MKTILFFTAAAAFISCVTSFEFNPKNLINAKFELSVTYGNGEENLNNLDESEEMQACKKNQREYVDCLSLININESECKSILENEKCKKFFDNPLSVMNDCNNLESQEQKDALNNLFQYFGNMFSLMCINNGSCPLVEDLLLYATKKSGNTYGWTSSSSNEGYIPSQEVIKNNCKSAECSEKAIETFTSIKKFYESTLEYTNKNEGKASDDEKKLLEKEIDELGQVLDDMQSCKSSSNASEKLIGSLLINVLTIIALYILF